MQLPRAKSADDDFPLSETGEELLFEVGEKAETPRKKIEFQRFESFQSFLDEAEFLDDEDLTFVEDNPFKRRRHHEPKDEEEPLGAAESDGDFIDDEFGDIEFLSDTEEDAGNKTPEDPEIKIEQEEEEEAAAKEYRYPLDYKMIKFTVQASESGFKKPSFWSHNLYRGPNNECVKVYYCTTKADSERVAQRFLNEEVLGFDMEWRYPQVDGLKNNASLIQLACEKEIALFHIAVHQGDTLEEILAPSLTKIIESDKITKCGVCILTADGARCREYLGMDPRGLFELSDLYWLIKYGNTEPHLITSKKKAMATQVEEHLGLPLWKGMVRTSNWSKRLNEEQIKYAAADAYAGFVLFKVMDAKREVMDPTPPRPAFAELKRPIMLADGTAAGRGFNRKRAKSVNKAEDKATKEQERGDATVQESKQVDPTVPQNRPAHADPTVQVVNIISTQCTHATTAPQKGRRRDRTKRANDLDDLDETGKRIFEALRKNRTIVAGKQAVPPYVIAHNTVLKDIAIQQPCTTKQLLSIRGIQKRTAESYGAAWLAIIRDILSEKEVAAQARTSDGAERSPESINLQSFEHDSPPNKTTPPSNGLKRSTNRFRMPPALELEQRTPSKLPAQAPTQTVPAPTTIKRSTSSPRSAAPLADSTRTISPFKSPAAPVPSMPSKLQAVPVPGFPAEQALARQRRIRSILNGIRIQLARRTNLPPHLIATDVTLDTISGIYPCTFAIINAAEGGGRLLEIAREQGVDILGVVGRCAPPGSVMPELPAGVPVKSLDHEGGDNDKDDDWGEEEAFAPVDSTRQADRRRVAAELESIPRPVIRKWRV